MVKECPLDENEGDMFMGEPDRIGGCDIELFEPWHCENEAGSVLGDGN